jgi:protein arginine kinase activator
MICQKCHKNLATARYAEVVDGKVTDLHLCGECMRRYQDNDVTGFELSGPVSRNTAPAPPQDPPVINVRTCRQCGTSLRDLMRLGRVGCPACYESFAEQLDPLLRGLHTSIRHRGKSPRIDDARERLRAELQGKRALLRSALKLENYEEAAVLRDNVRSLEDELGIASVEHS